MEHQMKTKLKLVLALTLTLAACEKEQFVLIATETANYRFNESMKWNKYHPDRVISVTTDDYTILSVADCHIGTTKNLNRFFTNTKTTRFDAIVMNGDITLGHDYDYDAFEKCLPDRDSFQLFMIAGNHDIYFNGWEEYFARFGSSTYTFTIKTPQAADLFICLDTSGGTLGDEQLNWLEETLIARRAGYRHCFVITHNNLFRERHSTSTNPFVEELKVLISLFTKYRVDMVITGHDHQRADTKFGVTRYIQLDAFNDEADNASYFKLNIKSEAVTYGFEKIK
jgi:predicted phosphodiesterase